MDDKEIISYIKHKKEKGIELLVNEYGALMKSIINEQLGMLNDFTEECLNDVLLLIWNNIESFDESKNQFKNWIGAISKYKAIDYKRKYIKYLNYENIENLNIVSSQKVDTDLLNEELKEEVADLLKNLNETDREIFKKYYLKEESIKEIAREMKIKDTSIYNKLSRGRRKIRGIMESFWR